MEAVKRIAHAGFEERGWKTHEPALVCRLDRDLPQQRRCQAPRLTQKPVRVRPVLEMHDHGIHGAHRRGAASRAPYDTGTTSYGHRSEAADRVRLTHNGESQVGRDVGRAARYGRACVPLETLGAWRTPRTASSTSSRDGFSTSSGSCVPWRSGSERPRGAAASSTTSPTKSC